jgi:Rieske Fe-S protein
MENVPYWIDRAAIKRFPRLQKNVGVATKLKRGEAMRIGSQGKKRVVFQHRNGKVHKLSPVCTHRGCLVSWNSTESTWNDACHCSRFKPTGEVIAGPAEKGLASI